MNSIHKMVGQWFQIKYNVLQCTNFALLIVIVYSLFVSSPIFAALLYGGVGFFCAVCAIALVFALNHRFTMIVDDEVVAVASAEFDSCYILPFSEQVLWYKKYKLADYCKALDEVRYVCSVAEEANKRNCPNIGIRYNIFSCRERERIRIVVLSTGMTFPLVRLFVDHARSSIPKEVVEKGIAKHYDRVMKDFVPYRVRSRGSINGHPE